MLPEGWSWERLGNISTIARGGSPRPIKAFITDDANGVNWIKIGDTEKDGKYIFSTKEKIKPEGVSKSRFVKSGDFLLTNSMSFGRPYILKTNGWTVNYYHEHYDKISKERNAGRCKA